MTKAGTRHFKNGGNIINTASVTAYPGSPELLDYSATKGAIVVFTRSLSQALANKKSVSMPSRRGRSGLRLFHQHIPRKRSQRLAPTRRSGVRVNQKNWRPVLCFWLRKIPPT